MVHTRNQLFVHLSSRGGSDLNASLCSAFTPGKHGIVVFSVPAFWGAREFRRGGNLVAEGKVKKEKKHFVSFVMLICWSLCLGEIVDEFEIWTRVGVGGSNNRVRE